MGLLENIYDMSPIFFQNIMVNLAGYHKNRYRYGKAYYEHKEFLSDFDTWDQEKKQAYQNRELIRIVKHAAENSPFYKKLYEKIDISSIQGIQDLKILPIVDKEMLRDNMDNVVTILKKDAVKERTGGTTGKSLIVFGTVEDIMKRMAMLDNFKLRVGFEHRKMKRATFNGKHIVPPRQQEKVFWRYNGACKQMIYSSFHLTEENMRYYVESLNQYKPHAIDGFFMSMCDIAQYIERHSLKLEFSPIAIFPTSETLNASGRELLERVFGCKVYDQYASSEGAPFVTECKDQNLHIEMASGVFESFEEDSDEILVTSFTTYGTPLIRYRIGDSMIFTDQDNPKCRCETEAPIVKKIRGRMLDFLYTAEGAKINAGNISNLFKNIPNALIKAQIVQNKLDEITIFLETDKKRYKSEYDVMLINEFLYKFGSGTKIIIQHIDQISREKSGKFRMIKNNVKIGED